jgi:hypothetical protein
VVEPRSIAGSVRGGNATIELPARSVAMIALD